MFLTYLTIHSDAIDSLKSLKCQDKTSLSSNMPS
jgi:hypothetical protein